MNINDQSLAMLTPARCRLLPLTKMKITNKPHPNTKVDHPITVRYYRTKYSKILTTSTYYGCSALTQFHYTRTTLPRRPKTTKNRKC